MSPLYKGAGFAIGVMCMTWMTCNAGPAYAADLTYGTNNEFGSITCATT